MSYNIRFTKDAQKDFYLVKNSILSKKAKELFSILEINPFQNPPPFERLKGNFSGLYSRRLNKQHRLVYMVKDLEVIVVSMWTHYENL